MERVKRILICITGIMVLCGKCPVLSHPHVFIETSMEFIFNESELKGFRLKWVFDEMFSSVVMQDCDKNKDILLDKKEIRIIEKDYFSNLKNYNYLCHLIHKDKKCEIKGVKEFNAYMNEDKKLVYNFFVPVNIELNEQFKSIKLTVYDDTYYIAVGLLKTNPVQVTGISEENYNYKCIRNSRDIIYYGQTMPIQVVLEFKK